jgi:hypothetical protein
MLNTLHKLLLFCMMPILLLTSCAGPYIAKENEQYLAYSIPGHENPADKALPVFLVENPGQHFNLIGTPRAATGKDGQERVFVDTATPTVYSQLYRFSTEKDSYTNVVYRIHFPETPFTLLPLQIGAGKNVGLLFIVTFDKLERPVLVTTLHTCGCYLAFVPTSFLPDAALPDGWRKDQRQYVYSQSLPGLLDYSGLDPRTVRLVFQIENASHRIHDIRLSDSTSLPGQQARMAQLASLQSLDTLATKDGKTVSFYETSGPRKGYVRDSHKTGERVLISWWALDWRVGEDKKFVPDSTNEPVFYTSLKPWARQASDIRNFPLFLRYWGWKL